MTNRNALSPHRCTFLGATGRLCGRERLKDCPYAICAKHAGKVYEFMASRQPKPDPTEAEKKLARLDMARDEIAATDAKRRSALEEQSQVYYVRIHDHIKIGYTTNITARMGQLRVSTSAVLATEPGGQATERERHTEFADERIGRREDFNPSPRLLAHIEQVKAQHGEPRLTTWPKLTT
jgi:hypothetical protein